MGSNRDFNGLLQFQADQLTVLGVILFYSAFFLNSFIPLRLLGSFFHVAMNGKAASDKIFTLLDTPVETQAQASILQRKMPFKWISKILYFLIVKKNLRLLA